MKNRNFLLQKLTSLDSFSVPVSLSLGGRTKHKTAIGGAVSLFAYGVITLYFMTKSITWYADPVYRQTFNRSFRKTGEDQTEMVPTKTFLPAVRTYTYRKDGSKVDDEAYISFVQKFDATDDDREDLDVGMINCNLLIDSWYESGELTLVEAESYRQDGFLSEAEFYYCPKTTQFELMREGNRDLGGTFLSLLVKWDDRDTVFAEREYDREIEVLEITR